MLQGGLIALAGAGLLVTTALHWARLVVVPMPNGERAMELQPGHSTIDLGEATTLVAALATLILVAGAAIIAVRTRPLGLALRMVAALSAVAVAVRCSAFWQAAADSPHALLEIFISGRADASPKVVDHWATTLEAGGLRVQPGPGLLVAAAALVLVVAGLLIPLLPSTSQRRARVARPEAPVSAMGAVR